MNCVSVYRVGADGSSYSFGGEVPDADLPCAVWLGWLPLALPVFEAPGVALAEDAWLTMSEASSGGERGAAGAGVVTAAEAAAELAARGACNLTAFTSSPADLPADGVLSASSLALLVTDDLEALVGRLRDSHVALLVAGDDVDEEVTTLDACQARAGGDSPARHRYGLALRDFREHQLRLHRLLEAVVRIGIFDPAAASRFPSRPVPAGPSSEWDSAS